MNLTEFLLARIAEDEAVAKAAEDPGVWEVRPYIQSGVEGEVHVVSVNGPNYAYGAVCGAEYEGYHSTVTLGNAAHIARFDPARVLAECEAKRRIVEQVAPMVERVEGYAVDGGIHYEPEDQRRPHIDLLRALALPYVDHPDFNPDWRIN